MPSWCGAQLKQRDNFIFYLLPLQEESNVWENKHVNEKYYEDAEQEIIFHNF
jgi:hypothetical protein